ncbi:MAG: MBL fold metallo-hydrolase, partial [Nocardioidaceae bacterium]|nr:MBL fold metallo-hydrolase [Nocardioidaceae bacterium]
MRLTIVGCSGSYPGPEAPASCYLLEADDAGGRTWRVLLDLGNGALGALHRYADPLAVDAVLLSHLHADH